MKDKEEEERGGKEHAERGRTRRRKRKTRRTRWKSSGEKEEEDNKEKQVDLGQRSQASHKGDRMVAAHLHAAQALEMAESAQRARLGCKVALPCPRNFQTPQVAALAHEDQIRGTGDGNAELRKPRGSAQLREDRLHGATGDCGTEVFRGGSGSVPEVALGTANRFKAAQLRHQPCGAQDASRLLQRACLDASGCVCAPRNRGFDNRGRYPRFFSDVELQHRPIYHAAHGLADTSEVASVLKVQFRQDDRHHVRWHFLKGGGHVRLGPLRFVAESGP